MGWVERNATRCFTIDSRHAPRRMARRLAASARHGRRQRHAAPSGSASEVARPIRRYRSDSHCVLLDSAPFVDDSRNVVNYEMRSYENTLVKGNQAAESTQAGPRTRYSGLQDHVSGRCRARRMAGMTPRCRPPCCFVCRLSQSDACHAVERRNRLILGSVAADLGCRCFLHDIPHEGSRAPSRQPARYRLSLGG